MISNTLIKWKHNKNSILKFKSMKYTFFSIVFSVFMCILPQGSVLNAKNDNVVEDQISHQQKTAIKGKVIDSNGEPIIGATVVEQSESTNGTITDIYGAFSLVVNTNAVLNITYIGYAPQKVNATPGKEIIVTLVEDQKILDEIIVVGYGQQRVSTVTGSVSQIRTEKITTAPQSNVSNLLAGQLPGLITKQTSGIPGADDSSLNIRGFGTPLVIVDGIETSINNLDANQIETISILKDGAASIYGARAGRGVILVTTKRGKQSKPTVSVNSSLTWQGSTKVIKPASSAERAQHEVNKWIYAGNAPEDAPFSPEEIQKFKDGTDPKYLNTDWFDASIRRFAPQQNHNVSLTGGTEAVKYYGYFGYNTQETILKKNGGNYDRYNFQVNLDAKISERISMLMDLQHFREQRFYPSGADGVATNSNFWRDLIYAADPSYALTLPDPTKAAYAGVTYGSPVWATNSDLSGYQDKRNNITQFKGEVKYDSKFISGLFAKGTVIYRENTYDQKVVKKQEDFYTYSAETDKYTLVRSSQDPQLLNRGSSVHTQIVQQYSLNYNKVINNAHNITGLFLYEQQEDKSRGFNTSRGGYKSLAIEEFIGGDTSTSSNSSSSSSEARISWIGRLNYSYMDRYLVETILRADASSRFLKGHRWGYFPSISLGWNIAKEDFMKQYDQIDNMKLRTSYGQAGNDDVAYYAYLAGYQYDATYTIGNELISALGSRALPNPLLTWEDMETYNVGLDFSLFKSKLYGEFDYYYRKRNGIPGHRINSIPSSFGATPPQENLNSMSTTGFELRLGTSGKFGDLNYDVSGNIARSRSTWQKYDEANYTDPDEIRLYKNTGKYIDRRVGYVFDGLFTSQEEIDSWDKTFAHLNNDNSSLKPGDVKYKDLNNDGIIDWRDQKEIGKGAEPHWTYGLHFNLQYKDFDFSALLQGAFDYTTYINLVSASTELQYKNYWNLETNNKGDALLPRPNGSATNDFYSDYRNHNTSYIRLKNLSLGYSVPSPLLMRVGVSKLRVYVAGTNLLTFSSLKKYGVDPEMPEGYGAGVYYPQQFTLSVGCNLTF